MKWNKNEIKDYIRKESNRKTTKPRRKNKLAEVHGIPVDVLLWRKIFRAAAYPFIQIYKWVSGFLLKQKHLHVFEKDSYIFYFANAEKSTPELRQFKSAQKKLFLDNFLQKYKKRAGDIYVHWVERYKALFKKEQSADSSAHMSRTKGDKKLSAVWNAIRNYFDKKIYAYKLSIADSLNIPRYKKDEFAQENVFFVTWQWIRSIPHRIAAYVKQRSTIFKVATPILIVVVFFSCQTVLGNTAKAIDSLNIVSPEAVSKNELVDACEITLEGNTVAIAESEEVVYDAIDDIRASYEAAENLDTSKTELSLDFEAVRTTSDNITSSENLRSLLVTALRFKISGYELLMDGVHVAYFTSEEECLQALERAKTKYVNRNLSDKTVLSIDIQTEYSIEPVDVLSTQMASLSEAVNAIIDGTPVQKTYYVSGIEELNEIAQEKNLLYSEEYNKTLELINNAAVINKDVSNAVSNSIIITPYGELPSKYPFVVTEPLATFVATVESRVTETIPYSTIYKTDSSMLYTRSIVSRNGSNGIKTAVYGDTYVNGVLTESNLISSQVTSAPVDKIIIKGTAMSSGTYIYAHSGGNGMFIWPTTGLVTTVYGTRGSLWPNGHTGFDIANSAGTPIYAAASGTVITATYSSNYGYYVEIKHNATYTTRYCHMTRYAVTAGQTVSQGELIGYMGATGKVTGVHLHLEMLQNGATINPVTVIY